MFLNLFYPFIKFVLGTLYPAYKTWKSLKRKDELIRKRWIKYWISYSVFQTVEYFADLTIAYVMPFYIELKLSALMWLVHMRTSSLIDSAVDKELKRREKAIDSWLRRFHNEFVGVVWSEVSRFLIRFLATLLKSMAASHHVPITNEPHHIDEDCDIDMTISNTSPGNDSMIGGDAGVRDANSNYDRDLDGELSERGYDRVETVSARERRYKRERGSLVRIMSID